LRNASGQAVYQIQAPVVDGNIYQRIQLSGLPNGVYFYTLYDHKGMIRKSDKLIKM
jgi:hypothetical protein